MPEKTLTEGDFAQIKLLFIEETEPIKKLVDRHEQTLFGPEGDNGLNRRIKEHADKLDELDGLKKKAMGVFAAIQLGVGAAAYWLPKWFERK